MSLIELDQNQVNGVVFTATTTNLWIGFGVNLNIDSCRSAIHTEVQFSISRYFRELVSSFIPTNNRYPRFLCFHTYNQIKLQWLTKWLLLAVISTSDELRTYFYKFPNCKVRGLSKPYKQYLGHIYRRGRTKGTASCLWHNNEGAGGCIEVGPKVLQLRGQGEDCN